MEDTICAVSTAPGTVAGNFYRVFAGKRMRCAEKGDQHLVYELFTTPDTTVTQCIGFL